MENNFIKRNLIKKKKKKVWIVNGIGSHKKRIGSA